MSNFNVRHKKLTMLAGVIAVFIIFTIIRNVSYKDFIYKIQHSDMAVQPILGEITRFPHSIIAKRLAVLHTELSRRDREHADCNNPEYENRMTCANLVYIPKGNFLVVVSDIKILVDITDENGKRIALDYEPIAEDKLQKVIHHMENL